MEKFDDGSHQAGGGEYSLIMIKSGKAVFLLRGRFVGLKINRIRSVALIAVFACCSLPIRSEPPEWWQQIHNYDGVTDWHRYMTYSSAYFGPNAMPVPDWQDGKVPFTHGATISTDVFWGFGDQTQSFSGLLTYVFVPGRFSINGWGVLLERYKTTTAIRDYRASLIESAEETFLIGDLYVSTQMALLKETRRNPDVTLDAILKTASSKTAAGARYFDSPGYGFRMAVGKTWRPASALVDSVRFAVNYGFMCYQLNNNSQNDAQIYAALIQISRGAVVWENGLGGYDGWARGSEPMVLRSKVTWKKGKMSYFIGYQHAFRDYPFRRIQTGVALSLN